MEVPVFMGDQACGTLRAERQGLYTRFSAQVDTDALCRLYAEFEGGQTGLGIPAPENGAMCLNISVPTRCLPPGRLCRGCLRTGKAQWEQFPGGDFHGFSLPQGKRQGERFRFPWSPGDPIPCEELLCFFRYVEEEGSWLELQMDETGCPRV